MKLPRRRRLGSSLAQGLLTGMALGYAYRAATLVVNARTFPRLDRKHAAVSPRPKVSLLTPARDEALNVPKLLGGLLRQGADEVILLDDHSSDGTGDIARELCQGVPGGQVVSGTPLPEGWAGKNWACHQLSQAASGDVLIFVDADVEWKNGALDALLAELERSEADLLSCWPRQNVGSAQERLITPLIDLYLLSLLPYPAMQLPLVATATAVGQVMVFRRAAYDAVGGHTLVQGRPGRRPVRQAAQGPWLPGHGVCWAADVLASGCTTTTPLRSMAMPKAGCLCTATHAWRWPQPWPASSACIPSPGCWTFQGRAC
ncbi:glycosyltransferase family 2 protein [Deinococcus radiophilus]|uniref:glycosyltransferase family 2 protein n=1 Tax=Deinococcus radiophilus TaxID=32062 RepID=UPI003617AE34